MLSDLCKEQYCHCLCLQETHRGERKARPKIPGMTLVAERPHDKYESAIFIRDDLKVKSISVTAANHVEVITAELPDVVVHSVYKPPSEQFVLPSLGQRGLPQIVIGNFNSHNTRRRFNLRKANWSEYTRDVDILVGEVDLTPENYERFVEAIRVTSRKHIPRGV